MWERFIKEEKKKEYFKKIEEFLKGKEFFPERKNILKAFKETPFEELKVVIVGQDPYHTPGMAQGLAFSVPTEFTPKPPSLKNILKELESDIGPNAIALKTKGDLTPWAKNGVFLINTILTVEKGKPLSHKDIGWETFTKNAIDLISKEKENVVFILWGGNARKFKKIIDTDKHYIIESAHPSPLSSYRGFFDSKPFSTTNKYLKEKINW